MLFFDEENSIVKNSMILGIERRWLPAAVLAAVALCLFLIGSKILLPTNAQADLKTGFERSEILVVPMQLDRDCYGLAMVDTVGQTLWIYEINNRGPAYSRLKLVAARSWRYDKQLEQYNTAEPKPEQVKALLEGLGQQKKLNREEQPNVVDVNVPQVNVPDTNVGKQ